MNKHCNGNTFNLPKKKSNKLENKIKLKLCSTL